MGGFASQVSRAKIGDYLILEKIGQGATASVYAGQKQSTGQPVAIKIVAPSVISSKEQGMRFARECQVARTLEHPHIVQVLDFGMEGSKAFMVMEYVDGESLAKRLQREGRLPEAEALTITTQVGEALEWIHQRRLVHRDVKPGNILLTRDAQAKLSDLGVVKDLENLSQLTLDIDILGTPNFMAPEQFENAQKVDARSDLYSLAATLYMVVTGEVPFGAGETDSLVSVMKKKFSDDIPPPDRLVPGLSKHVSEAIARALRNNPKERQASVMEFMQAVNGAERRVAERFPAQRPTSCQPLQRLTDDSWSGEVVDISETGLCLQLNRRFEPGSLLTVVLEDERGEQRNVVIQVRWTRKASGESWRIGGRFDQPLCEFEIDAFRKVPEESQVESDQ